MGLDDAKIKKIPQTKLQVEYSDAITLIHLDSVLIFMKKILTKWKETSTHVRVAEDSFSLSTNIGSIKANINRFGGVNLLDYISAINKDLFYITADFGRNMLRVRASNNEILNTIKTMWIGSAMEVSPEGEISLISLQRSAKRFILSCMDFHRRLYERKNERLKLSQAYVVAGFYDKELQNIITSFADVIRRKQNKNGGWGSTEQSRRSEVMPTANVAIVLSMSKSDNIKIKESLDKAVKFIKQKQRTNGSWTSKGFNSNYVTTFCALALKFSGYNEQSFQILLPFINKWLKRAPISELNPVVVQLMQDAKIDIKFATNRLMDYFASFKTVNDVVQEHDIATLSLYTDILIRTEKLTDRRREEILDILRTTRNSDGGWARIRNETSELSTTIFILSILEKLTTK